MGVAKNASNFASLLPVGGRHVGFCALTTDACSSAVARVIVRPDRAVMAKRLRSRMWVAEGSRKLPTGVVGSPAQLR